MALAMSPGVRKLALTIHLTSSLGWVGAVIAYLALGLSAVNSGDTQAVLAAWIAMELTGWYVIVPLAVASFVTGLVMSLATPWGLFRHYWVVISLILTLFSVVILILHMPSVSAITDSLRAASADDGAAPATSAGNSAHGGPAGHGGPASHGVAGGDLFHPGVGLVVLLIVTTLNVYKPRGLTRYGWRKQQEERARLAQRSASAGCRGHL
jgi:hypothetical protein